MLGGFELGDEVLDVYGVDKTFYNADLIDNSCCMTDMNSEYRLWWDMSSYIVAIVLMYVEIAWICKCVIFS